MAMMAVVMDPKSKSPPIRVAPPRIIIVVRRIGSWIVIIFFPKVDLFACKKRVPVIHFPKGSDLLSENFPGHCNLPSLLEKVRVQIFLGEN